MAPGSQTARRAACDPFGRQRGSDRAQRFPRKRVSEHPSHDRRREWLMTYCAFISSGQS